MRFSLGDAVELTPSAKAVNVEPWKYERGVIVDPSGVWNIYAVKWNGIDHPIGMRADEIMLAKEVGRMAELFETPFWEILCGRCGYCIECDENGDMPDVCPECGATLDWDGMEDE